MNKKTLPYFLLLIVPFLLFCLVILHFYSLDGLQGWLASKFFVEDNNYSSNYSDKSFRMIKKEMTEKEVLDILGEPLHEYWYYEFCYRITLKNNKVKYVYNPLPKNINRYFKIKKDMSNKEVLSLLNKPLIYIWYYSESPSSKSYRIRRIEFRNRKVEKKISEFYVD